MPRFPTKIGTSPETMVYTENLPVPVTIGFAPYKAYQETVTIGDASSRGVGFSEGIWRMGFLKRAQRDQLRVFCPGASSIVYIDTPINDDTQYHTFKAIMHWPEEEDPQANRFLDVVIRFTLLEELS